MTAWSTRFRLDGRWFDRTLALALLIACETELALKQPRHGSRVADVLLLGAMTIPIAWRRRAPLGVACLVMAIVVASAATAGGLTKLLQTTQFALFIPPYSVAAYESRRRALAGLVACFTGICLVSTVGSGRAAAWIFGLGMCAASWGAGRALRSRRALAAQLRGTAELIAVEREDRERLAVANERSRIARELQAVVAHSVSSMVVQSEAAQRLLDTDRAQADAAMAAIEQTGRQALTEMRRILGILRRNEDEAELAPQPGVGQLHALIEHARGEGRKIELQVDGEPRPLPPSVDLGVYRILQEALTSTRDNADGTDPIAVVLHFGEAEIA